MNYKSKRKKKKKSLIEILRSDLSKETIKDLFTYEIPLPYSRATVAKARMAVQDEGMSEKQIKDLMAELERQSDQISAVLMERGLIKEEDLTRIEEEKEKTGLPILQVLVSLGIVSPDQISDLAQSLQSAIESEQTGTRLEDCLKKKGLLAEGGIEKAKEMSRLEKIGLEEALVRSEAISFDELSKVIEEEFEIEPIDLKKEKVDRNAVNLLPDHIMKTFHLIPVERDEEMLFIAMANPLDGTALEKIRMMTGLEPIPFFADRDAVERAQKHFIVEIDAEARVVGTDSAAKQLEESATSDSTVKLVSNIIEGAVNSRATDIHLEPQSDNLRVRYRVDGMLYDLMRIPGDQAAATVSRIKVLAHMDITERRRPQDGHATIMTTGRREISLRASTLPTQYGEKIVLRVVQDSSVVRGLKQLGLSHDEMTLIKEMVAYPHGMLLVTGPMGSGKTTTLYAAIGEVNIPSKNIVTIEDPIEYALPGINQVQTDSKIDLNFANGLRAVLRQDANVLMVGEIRDSETANVAARAASTGHLLFSTLHTNTAVGAVSTLRHLGVPSFIIANTLICVVSQRLIRKVCPHCSEEYTPAKSTAATLGIAKGSKQTILRSKGCDKCLHTGYIGRTGVYEILKINDKLAELITEEGSEKEIFDASLAEGYKTLEANAVQKVLDGVTTAEELFRIIVL